jgi:carboxymethylenebutenolidase
MHQGGQAVARIERSSPIDDRVFGLYDEYCHGGMDRREFLRRAAALSVAGGSALAMAESLLPRYAAAGTVASADPRIEASRVTVPSPGGTAETIRGYLVQPSGAGPFPSVLVVHENRGLNPYVEDVARRLAVAGFLALAPDGLSSLGGYPGDDDTGRTMQAKLDEAKLRTDMANGARAVKSHARSSGRLGAVGFCWGGGVVNHLAARLGAELGAAVPFYGPAPAASEVPRIEAPLLLHFAENDPRINAGWADYRAALDAHGKRYEAHVYPGTQHGFHNDSTPRYDEAAAKLAWERTIAFLEQRLAQPPAGAAPRAGLADPAAPAPGR